MIQSIQVLSLSGETLKIGGVVYIANVDNTGSIKHLDFVNRSTGQIYTVPLVTSVKPELAEGDHDSHYDYSDGGFFITTIELSKLIPDGDYGVSLTVQVGDVVVSEPIRLFEYTWQLHTKPSVSGTHSIIPYYVKGEMRIRFRQAGKLGRTGTILRRVLRNGIFETAMLVNRRQWKAYLLFHLYRLNEKRLRGKQIWLFGERADTAQDNSFQMYKYVRENQLVENCYYVIDKKSADYRRVAELGNIIQFGTFKHTLYLLTCAKSINAYAERINMHTREYVQVLKCHPEWLQNHKYYLRHGVTGLSRIDYALNKLRTGFSLFVVSSQFEKDHYIAEYGYDDQDIAVTGLARWDQLINKGIGDTILLMPTWRRWIRSKQQLSDSEFMQRYMSLLRNATLHDILETHDLNLVFYPHYHIQQFMDDMPEIHPRIQIIRQGQETVQSLLLRSDLLVTDYSSVAFDFSYMQKPVIFYQFDYDKFHDEHNKPGPISQNKLFGEVTRDEDAVVDGVRRFANKDGAFMSAAKDNPYIFRAPGQHRRLVYEAILAR